ncbi:MAG: type II toxin-antitoxin system VapC family toxin [Gemmatales bacterium]
MSHYILDSNILSLLQDGNDNVVKNFSRHPSGGLCVTVIAVIERLNGWYRVVGKDGTDDEKIRRYGNLAKTAKLLSRFEIHSFSKMSLAKFKELHSLRLEGFGKKEEKDLRMAAIALDYPDAIFVTQNVKHFKVIPGFLPIEDWTKYPATKHSSTH